MSACLSVAAENLNIMLCMACLYSLYTVASVCLCVPSLCVHIIILAFIYSAMSDTMIMDAIASHLVLPNRLTVPLVADLHIAQLRSPLPRVTVSFSVETWTTDWCRSVFWYQLQSSIKRFNTKWKIRIAFWPAFCVCSLCVFLRVHPRTRVLCVSTCWRLRTLPPRIRSSRA